MTSFRIFKKKEKVYSVNFEGGFRLLNQAAVTFHFVEMLYEWLLLCKSKTQRQKVTAKD